MRESKTKSLSKPMLRNCLHRIATMQPLCTTMSIRIGAREKIGICIFCGEAIYEGDEYKDDHGTFICQECFEEKYFICDCCVKFTLMTHRYGYMTAFICTVFAADIHPHLQSSFILRAAYSETTFRISLPADRFISA